MKRRTKRKIKKIFKKNIILIFAFIIIISLFLFKSAYSSMQTELTVNGSGSITGEIKDKDDVGSICQISLSYENIYSWGDFEGFFDIIMTNNSQEQLNNWILKIPKMEGLNYISGNNVVETTEAYYIFSSGWDSTIAPNESQKVRLGAKTTGIDIYKVLENTLFSGCGGHEGGNGTVTENGLTVELGNYEKKVDYEIATDNYNIWSKQLYQIVTVTNTSDKPSYGIRIIVDYGEGNSVDNMWQTYKDYPEKHQLEISSTGKVEPGSKVDFHINLKVSDESFKPKIIAIATIFE